MLLSLVLIALLSAGLFVVTLSAIPSANATARTWTVDDNGPADFHSIQTAINAASDYDTVLVSAGTYREHVVVNKTVTLISYENAVIDASDYLPSGIPKENLVPILSTWDGITTFSVNTIVSGFTIRDAENNGIHVRSNNTQIINNFITNCSYGVKLYGETDGYTDVPKNNCPIFDNITHNVITNCHVGIGCSNVKYSNITNNIIRNSEYIGIYLFSFSNNNKVDSNTVSDTTISAGNEGGYGIGLGTGANHNTIFNNTIMNNSRIGCDLELFGLGYPNASSNVVYGNRFINNTVQAYDSGENNQWDNGFSGGNYWSDYQGNDTNNDGIGEQPYLISINSRDNYPLLNQYTPVPTPTPTPTPITPIPTPTPTLHNTTSIQLFCYSVSSQSNFRVEMTGNLTYTGAGLPNQNIQLQISKDFGQSWTALTAVITGDHGQFDATWIPTVTGNYLLRAVFTGNQNIPSTNSIINCAVALLEAQNNFLVSSNSTLSALSFDPTTKTLTFSVSGPTGTTGSITVSIQKSLIANTSDLTVYLDGTELPYIVESQQDSWVLSFSYHHSSHQVEIKMDSQSSQQSNSLLQITPDVLMILAGIIMALLVSITAIFFAFRRNKSKPVGSK